MAKQLIHTSAPRGLDPGTSGFCVVARHRDLRERLIPLLERASAYHHQNRPAVDGAAPLNPVVYSHRIFSLGGGAYHVLSRIVDAGNDYTHRSNYLAHHLILDDVETAAAANANLNPADILLAFEKTGGWRNKWDEPPRFFSTADDVNILTLPKLLSALPAQTWKTLAGDPRCAAAPLFSASGKRAVFLTAPGGETKLPNLFRETLALLPAREAWGITFSSFAQSTDAAGDFLWQGAWDASAVISGALYDLSRTGGVPIPSDSPLTRRAAGAAAELPPVPDHFSHTEDAAGLPCASSLSRAHTPLRSTSRMQTGQFSLSALQENSATPQKNSALAELLKKPLLWVAAGLLAAAASLGGVFLYIEIANAEQEKKNTAAAEAKKRADEEVRRKRAADDDRQKKSK
jgi:hypothetical protein